MPAEADAVKPKKRKPSGQKMPDGSTAPFELESPRPGLPNENVIADLVLLRGNVADASADFNESVKAVAEKHKLKPGALKTYVAALHGNKLEDARAALNDLERLLDGEPLPKTEDLPQ